PIKLKASIPGRNTLEVSFSTPPPGWAQVLEALPYVESAAGEDNIFRIATTHGPATTMAVMEAAAKAGITVQSLSVQSTTLDDVFVHYAGRALRDALQEANPLERAPVMRRG